jgi:hypothetical protein
MLFSHIVMRSCWDSIFGLVTGIRVEQPRNRGSVPGRDKVFLSSPKRPDACSETK